MIAGITADSRKVEPGWLFAALPGAKSDGKAFVPQALARGAAAVLSSGEFPGLEAPVVRVHDPRRVYALAAATFYGRQPQGLRRGDRHQRQDLRRRFLPPDLRRGRA